MIFNVLMIMVTLASASMDPGATTNATHLRPKDECYVNGVWYNPCPESGPETPPPSPDPREPPIVLQDQ
jgi:hypothetical protein